jgi:hypothetical protein
MVKLPGWARGVFVSLAFLSVIFFLKIICPIDTGCFADPFVVIFFLPILFFEKVFGLPLVSLLGFYEPFLVILFWLCVGGVFGYWWGRVQAAKVEKNFFTE